MLKKILSALCLWAILGSAFTLPAYAGTVPATIIQSFTLSVANSTPQTFNPSAGQTLATTLTYDNTKTATSNGYVKVIQGSTVVKTLATWANSAPTAVIPAWDGKSVDVTGQTLCGNAGAVCPAGDYQIETEVDYVAGGNTNQDKQTKNFTITTTPSAILINSFDVNPTPSIAGGNFDPSKKGGNQLLEIKYNLNVIADNVLVEVINPKNNIVKTFASSKISDTFVWDGIYSAKLVTPGVYNVKITASKSGTANVTSSKVINVDYGSANKGAISGFSVSPISYNSNDGDVVIKFTNTADTYVTVEIRSLDDNTQVRYFLNYEDNNYGSNTLNSIAWDGRDSSGSSVPTGTYRVVITLRNDYGVVVSEQNVGVTNAASSSTSTENVHIAGISFSPSYTFDPGKNDQMKIEYDIKQKLDSLKIYAVRGTDKIELQSETSIDKQNNVEVDWDGTDTNGDYVDAGSWKIQFESKIGSITLIAAKTINVTYDKPKIDDVYVSKTKFDNEQGEFTYIFFRTDTAADVTIQLLQDGSEQENITEDMAVDANKWYAVSWDGSGYSYDDNLDIKVLAQNTVNHNIFNSKKVSIDIAEDKVSSTKSNVTQDYMDPVVTDGTQEMKLFYNLSENADVKATIHRGNTSTGTIVSTLLDVSDQNSGDHVITWNGKDDNGNTLSKGLYTYKIISNTTTSDTETGLFVVGNVGDVEGSGSSTGTSISSNNGGKVGTGVVIDGKGGSTGSTSKLCAGFSDVKTTNKYCTAIQWVKEQGIFKGYNDGTFGVDSQIARVELLKVIMEALGIKTQTAVGNLGFIDVTPGLWYMPYIQAAKGLGIANGDAGKNTIRPYDSTQRVEALKMIFEAMKSAGAIGQINGQCKAAHTDAIGGSWYGKYICESDSLDLYDYDSSGYFGIDTLSTRGEVAEVLYRLHLKSLL
ncbi:MAG: S-layer homology domain-containing protein [Candidatus Peregrinibacteria bacterium]|nr:S-layer homology domain-containing protein [Candidatus Peregrinibacteria bacterium]